MPQIYDAYEKCSDLLNDKVLVRLFSGDRKKTEAITKGKWDKQNEKPDLPQIVEMLKAFESSEKLVYIYVSNHYNGYAPLTIGKIQEMFHT